MSNTNEILIEKSLLSLILKSQSKELFQRLVARIDSNYFTSSIHKWIYEVIVKHFVQFAEIPTKIVFKSSLALLSEQSNAETKSILKSIYLLHVNTSDFEYLLDKLVKQKKYQEYLKIVNRSVNTMNVDNIDSELDNFFIKISNISSESTKELSTVRRFDLSENLLDQFSRFEVNPKSVKGIPTPITELNASMGGLKKQQLIVITAPTGEGKSILLLNFADFAYTLGYNVFYITIEMSYEDTESRNHSLVTGIESLKIQHRELNEKEKKKFYKELFLRYIIKEDHAAFLDHFKKIDFSNSFKHEAVHKEIADKFKFRSNHFYVRDIPSRCTIERMKTEFKYQRKLGNIDLVVIDYLNIIDPSFRSAAQWQDANQVTRSLKEWAREIDLPVLTAAQMKSTKDKPTIDDLRYAKAIADHADWMIGFNRSDQDKLCGRIKLELMKHRQSGEKSISIKETFSKMGISNFIDVDNIE